MFGLGAQELFIILLIIIVLFGASRLAGLGSALGSSIRDFKRAVRDTEEVSKQLETSLKSETARDGSAARTKQAS